MPQSTLSYSPPLLLTVVICNLGYFASLSSLSPLFSFPSLSISPFARRWPAFQGQTGERLFSPKKKAEKRREEGVDETGINQTLIDLTIKNV
jgi:hypothetical protein